MYCNFGFPKEHVIFTPILPGLKVGVFSSIVHSLFIDYCLYILLRLYSFKMCTENIYYYNFQKKKGVVKMTTLVLAKDRKLNKNVILNLKYQYLPLNKHLVFAKSCGQTTVGQI